MNAINDLADEALVDLRRLLGFLRSEGDELEARRPQPTLDDIEPLVDGFRQAGLPVEIVIEGKRRRLSAALQTSAYRLIQESLTNTLKHAGRATVFGGELSYGAGPRRVRRARPPADQAGECGMTIRLLLVDDHPLVRSGLRSLLENEPDLEVVGEASDGAEAVDLARLLRPDVVLMDLRMPGMDGIEAARRIAGKLGLRDRLQAVVFAYRSGVVISGEAQDQATRSTA